MHHAMHFVVHPAMQPAVQEDMQPCTLACNHACTLPCTHPAMQPDGVKPVCQRGYSPLQINLLAILKGHPSVISYDGIATAIREAYHMKATSGAVRGALSRLYKQGFLLRHQAGQGHIKGNRYTFLSDPCQHIPAYQSVHPAMHLDVQPAMQPAVHPVPLDRKKDYKNLSIYREEPDKPKNSTPQLALTGDGIAFHFPILAQQGFGTTQLQQIITRLAQTGTGTERLMQGLKHAEWELANGRMKDRAGKVVSNPLNWVFASLAKDGYYRRPQGYQSPEEQASQDAITETGNREQPLSGEQRPAEPSEVRQSPLASPETVRKTIADIQAVLRSPPTPSNTLADP